MCITPWNGWIRWGLAQCRTIVRGVNDEVISAKDTVTPADLGTVTATNGSSREFARSLGNSKDDAGHILAKSLGGQGGKGNVFPQLPAVNRSDFRVFEKDVGKLIKNKGTADIEWSFKYANGGTRPTGIQYDVYQNGQKVLGQFFGN